MRRFLLAAMLSVAATEPVWAQSAAMKTFTASAEVTALIAQAKAQRKDDQPLVGLPILSMAPYRATLEYRAGNSPPAKHDDAEMFYVIEGTGTLITGGALVDEKRLNPTNLRGTSISGGASQTLAKGDFFIVGGSIAHQIMPTGGAPIVVMSVHFPIPAPAVP